MSFASKSLPVEGTESLIDSPISDRSSIAMDFAVAFEFWCEVRCAQRGLISSFFAGLAAAGRGRRRICGAPWVNAWLISASIPGSLRRC